MNSAVLNDEIDLLAALPLFVDFERDALKLLAFSADTRILRAGDVMFRKNDVADAAFLILSGTVALDEKDDGSPTTNIFGRGALLNQTALLAQVRRPATAVMREPGAILKITRTLMTRVMDTYPGIAAKLQKRLSSEIDNTLYSLERVTHNLAKAVEENSE